MNFKPFFIKIILSVVLFGVFLGCGATEKETSFSLSGVIQIDSAAKANNGSLFVIVARGHDVNNVIAHPGDSVVAVFPVAGNDGHFNIDLTDTDLVQGEEVMIMGLYDTDYKNNIPSIDPDDYVGFYFTSDSLKASYTLRNTNINMDFAVNRKVCNWDATVSGTISGSINGDVIIIGYTGEITALDFSTIDVDKIIAYQVLNKSTEIVAFESPVMPYGYDAPVENVYFFAIFDENGNGALDEGEWIGFHPTQDAGIPQLITVYAGVNEAADIAPSYEVKEPSAYPIILSGSVSMPIQFSDSQNKNSYVIVTKEGNPGGILENLAENILYFEKLMPDQGYYSIDLSETGLRAGDKAGIYLLWDRDYSGGFPSMNADDYIGYYYDHDQMSIYYEFVAGDNDNVHISVNKKIGDFDKTISGVIQESDALKQQGLSYQGQVLVYAGMGPVTSSNYAAIDYTSGVGYKTIQKQGPGPLNYELTILPLGIELPVTNLYLYVLYDKNENGRPDGGEYFGYHVETGETMPSPVAVYEDSAATFDLTVLTKVPVPSTDTISVSGSIIMPDLFMTAENPVAYAVILKDANPEDLIDLDIDDILYFEKIPVNETYYNIDLSSTALKTGDEIGVYILWDRDNAGCLPAFTPGDYIGYYIDNVNMTNLYTLVSGQNPNIDIIVDKEVFDINRTFSGHIIKDAFFELSETDYTGQIVMFIYNGTFDSFSFENINFNRIRGMKKFEKTGPLPLEYAIDVFPFGSELPVNNAYVFALYDENRNGKPDYGEYYGFHTDGLKMPKAINITETEPVKGGCDISMIRQLPVPGGQTITIKGEIDFNMLSDGVKAGYDTSLQSQEAFLVIGKEPEDGGALAIDIESLIGNSVVYFSKIPGTLTGGRLPFDVNLSNSGLSAGDRIGAFLLWEKDYAGGFPVLSKNDYLGIFNDKGNYDVYFPLTEGENDITPVTGLAADEGWHFDVNRKIFFNYPFDRVRVNFTVESTPLHKINGGDSLVLIAAHDDGVAGTDIDTDYAVILDTTDVEGVSTGVNVNKTVNLLPALIETIVTVDAQGDFVCIDDVKLIAFVDKNKNLEFDSGDLYGYYNSIHTGLNMSSITINDGTDIYIPIVLTRP